MQDAHHPSSGSGSDAHVAGTAAGGTEGPRDGLGQAPAVRWFISFSAFSVPQAAAPIAFALLALPLTGSPDDGALMILTLTLAQIVGVVPVARLGERFDAVTYLRLLMLVRTAALGAIAVLAWSGAPLGWLMAASGAAGLVSGTAYGSLRAILNHLVTQSKLPRALGIAATLNEVTFVSAPVVASLVGSYSPVLAVLALAVLGAGPILLLPTVQATERRSPRSGRGSLLTPAITLWLVCAVATSSTVAAIEIGAVALVLGFGLSPAWSFLFPVVLCAASVAGGLVVSIRNRMPRGPSVTVYLVLTSSGAILVALNTHVVLTAVGAVLVGSFLAPLSTYYSLILDALAPTGRRVEVFALLRTANSIGIIVVSLTLALFSLSVTLATSAILVLTLTLVTAAALVRGSRRAPRSRRHPTL